ncbi:MAG: hypothetical protein K1X94_36660, partial [Sandaracinaceae bacterium]|nr:hypothetical protein [Sandaracinaceae bacterium]
MSTPPSVVLLVGPKGAGKTRLASMLATVFGAYAVPVEALWIARAARPRPEHEARDVERAGFDRHAAGFDRHAAGFDRHAAGFDRHAAGFDRHAAGFDRHAAGFDEVTDHALAALARHALVVLDATGASEHSLRMVARLREHARLT